MRIVNAALSGFIVAISASAAYAGGGGPGGSVPEPATGALVVLVGAGILWWSRRR